MRVRVCLLLLLVLGSSCTPTAPESAPAARPQSVPADPPQFAPAPPDYRPQEGAFIVEFYVPGEIEVWFREYQSGRSQPDTSWAIAPVYARPDSTSDRTGTIHATIRWQSEPDGRRYPDSVIEFRPEPPGEPALWIEGSTDWGYGVLTETRRVAGPWVQLPSDVFGGEAWVQLRHEAPRTALSGSWKSVLDQLVSVQRVVGVGGAVLPEGAYVALATDSATVTFRPELPSDMACGQEVPPDPPADQVARYEVPISALFTEDGHARFAITYSKGC